MIIKKIIYKSNGIEMIPHISFWKDSPSLIKDGIIFLFTCGKRSSSGYDDLENDYSKNNSSSIVPNTPIVVDVNQSESSNNNGVGVVGGSGYGSI